MTDIKFTVDVIEKIVDSITKSNIAETPKVRNFFITIFRKFCERFILISSLLIYICKKTKNKKKNIDNIEYIGL